MKKIDAHLHLAKIVAGYCRRGELRAIGGGKCQWGSGEVFQLFPQNGDYGDDCFTAEQALAIMDRNDVERAVLMNGSMYGFQNIYHEELLEKNGVAYTLYTDIKPNPTIENVQNGVKAYKESGADFMITIGGGSSMDTGKGTQIPGREAFPSR